MLTVTPYCRVRSMECTAFVYTAAFLYVMISVFSETPPLAHSPAGPPLLASAVAIFALVSGHANTMLFLLMRDDLPKDYIQVACECGGLVTQIGTGLGAGAVALLVGTGAIAGSL